MAAVLGSDASSVPHPGSLRPTAPLALIATSVLLASLLLALGLAGWLSYRAEYREAQQRAMGIARLVASQTARMIEAADLFLMLTTDLAASADWSEPGTGAAIQGRLTALSDHLPYVLEYGIADADGNLRLTESAIAPDHNISDRPYFAVHRDAAEAGLFISELFRARFGRDAGRNVFAISRRISGPDGRFSGAAVIVFAPAGLAVYYRSLGGDFPLTFHLIDADTEILARDPPLPPSSPPESIGLPEIRAVIRSDRAGTVSASVDGIERVWSFQRVEAYPLYATVDFETAAVLRKWLDHVLGYVLFSLAALAALAGLSYELVRHSRREDRLRARLVSADALAQSQERLNAALLASGTGTYRWDLRSDTIYCDDNLCRLCGLPADRLGSRIDAFLAAIHPDDREEVRDAFEDCARDGTDLAMDYRVTWPDGTMRWLTNRGRTVRTPSGKPLHITGACTDVTVRRSAEEARRVSEERYRGIVEDQIELVCRFLPDTTLTFTNAAYAQHFGATPQTLIGRRLVDLIDSERRDHLLAHLASLTPQRPAGRTELRWTGPDGQRHCHIWTNRVILDSDGNPVEYQSVGTDISELKRAEQELMHAKAQAEEASLSKTRFLMAASHDLRQPLQTIGTLAAILENPLDQPERQRCLRSLREAHGSIVVLLNTLLDMNRLEMGGTTPRITDFPVARLLDSLFREFEPLARAKGLDLRVVRSGAIVRSDFGLLKELVRNLVSNAINYTVAGKVLLGCRRRDLKVRIEVWDTGIGIAEEQHGRIFEEFYQVDNPARKRDNGYGLGLAIAQRMADLLGSHVELCSTPGQGSVFRFALPLGSAMADAGDAAPLDQVGRTAPTGEASILLIEDDPAVLESLALLLQLEGFRIITAAQSEEALRRFEGHEKPPDVIVADYRLPGSGNGLEAICSIRECTGRTIPGIILTGEVSRSIARRIEEAGCAVLHKPGDALELTGLIRALLNNAAAVGRPL